METINPEIPAILLLRGVNVGGRQLIRMPELCAVAADCGCGRPQSILQSGNIVFHTREPASTLEPAIAEAVRRRFGLEVECFVRTLMEWEHVVARNPFAEAALDNPGHLLVMALRQTPTESDIRALRESIKGREIVGVDGRHLYLVYPDGIGRSPVTNAMIERRLGMMGTARNWNTVLKILSLSRA
jgi:uncharacterized protein (DUF1697 family)